MNECPDCNGVGVTTGHPGAAFGQRPCLRCYGCGLNEAAQKIIKDALDESGPRRASQLMDALQREKAEQKQSGEYREEDWDE